MPLSHRRQRPLGGVHGGDRIAGPGGDLVAASARGTVMGNRGILHDDQRRIGLCLADKGLAAIAALPGPAEGVLPEALSAIPEVALRTLHINLSELIRHLPGNNVAFARVPLAEIVDTPGQNLL